MDINQLSKIVKTKIKNNIKIQNIVIEDKTYLHLNHANHDKKKLHIKVSIDSIDLKKMDKVKRTRIIYKLLGHELKNYIHSIQLNIV